MADQYSRGILKLVIAQICQTIGWHSINVTPLEFLVDLMQEYLLRISKVTHRYAEILGRTEGNLDDLGLAFQHMNVLIPELLEYVRNVDSVPCIVAIPKYPVSRENHLNFLKPGSQEVVTRAVHVHEHLPAMFPASKDACSSEKAETPGNYAGTDAANNGNGVSSGCSESASPIEASPQSVFKRPGGVPMSEHASLAKRSKMMEEGRPLREIHSVIMTTSGFLSPAREGKLPEPRTPHPARADSPPTSSYPMVPPELKPEKKTKKVLKKGLESRKLDKENKKKNRVKELFKPDNISEIKGKKVGNAKEGGGGGGGGGVKVKPSKSAHANKAHPSSGSNASSASSASNATNASNASSTNGRSGSGGGGASHRELATTKTPKALQSRGLKSERVAPELGPTPTPAPPQKEEPVDKLPSEPDKQKLNIFKKISKPREEKNNLDVPEAAKYKDLDSRENSPGLVIDEHSEKHAVQRNDSDSKREEKKTPRTPEVHINEGGDATDTQSPTQDVYIFDDMSPPGTPSTPKTPELSVPLPVDLKKKKKDRNVRKKEQRSKSPKRSISPKKVKSSVEAQEMDVCDRPKTPQAMETETSHKETSHSVSMPFPFFPPFPSAPGLIPHPIGHPLFPRYPLALAGRGVPGAHPAMPNLPIPPRFLTTNIRAPEESLPPKIHLPEREKPPLHSTNDDVLYADRTLDKHHQKLGKKLDKLDKESGQPAPIPSVLPQNDFTGSSVSLNNAPAASTAPHPRLIPKNDKLDKLEKNNKKSKDHKKERKDKLKKKKEKKEKHKIKDKSKGKKGKLTKLKDKKDKKDKRKEKEKDDNSAESVPKITLKLGPASPRSPTPESTTMKKITIKPLVKKPEEEKKRDPSPELAKISALVTRPPKQKVAKVKSELVSKKVDGIDEKENGKDISSQSNTAEGSRQIWICPTCGNQDDGSPMIGCDDCDAWYHWVCVGVQVPPADHEDWYCRLCIAKKQELHHDKKKKKRKKKVKAM